MKRLILALLAVATWGTVSAQVGRAAFTVQLGNFESKGEITYPASGKGPFPTVLLIHGSTPMDMDATIQEGDRVHSSIFKQLADFLPTKGFAVVRYNKRFVSGPGQANLERFYALKLQDFLSDARTVLTLARSSPLVDGKRLFVYGWSEGSPIAAQLALENPDLRGVIVQGPVAYSFAQTFQQQFPRVGLPYLERYATAGKLDVKAALEAQKGDGGLLARSFAFFLLDPTASPDAPRLNPSMDQNKDGLIDLEREAVPVFAFFYQDSPQTLGMYSSAQALPGLIALAPKLTMPLLILQGENDANTAPDGARALDAALNSGDHTLKLYPGLGHSLGTAKDVTDDDFRPMDAKPLEDIAVWLGARTL